MNQVSKFLSLNQLILGAVSALKRFPLSLLSAAVGAVAGVMLLAPGEVANEQVLQKLLMTAALGLSLFTVLTINSEKRRFSRIQTIVAQAVGLAALLAYYLSLPQDIEAIAATGIRFAVLVVGVHAMVACLPFIGGNQVRGFWQYNKALFLRFLFATLYAGVLYVGLAIALAAADNLFGLDVEEIRYFQLWILLTGLFHPWVFLAGVPDDYDQLDQSTDYPKGLILFAQYILLPLVGLYFLILISYEAKIVFTWNWPRGWVSNLVLWYSVVGIMSLLLLHPLRDRSDRSDRRDQRWVQIFVKSFFWTLVPLVTMLFLAIIRRVSDYGITEPRYFVLGLAVGLAVVMFYFLFSKAKDIRIIPIVLGLLAFVSAYGPWSAFSVSLDSQSARLEAKLIESGILIDGAIQTPDEVPSVELRREMSSIVKYLSDFHGIEAFSSWADDSSLARIDSLPRYSRHKQLAEFLEFGYLGGVYWPQDSRTAIMIVSANPGAIAIAGYDYLIRLDLNRSNSFSHACLLENDSCFVTLANDRIILEVSVGMDRESTLDMAVLELSDTLASHQTGRYADQAMSDAMIFRMAGETFEAQLKIDRFQGNIGPNVRSVEKFAGYLLLKRK